MGLRLSCLIHGALLLLVSGCAAHRLVTAPVLPDTEITEAKDFVVAVADKMPLWDADSISRYELVEIATVKADIAMAQQAEEKGPFLEYVGKLHIDWDALVALDEMLKKESLT
jgi:aromatic ring-opening dioxygenase catalytic subunit (LigB family)